MLDRHKTRVPITSENLLTALQSHRRMSNGPMALVAGNVEADRVANVVLDGVLLPGADRLPIDLSLVRFGPEIPGVPRIAAILE